MPILIQKDTGARWAGRVRRALKAERHDTLCLQSGKSDRRKEEREREEEEERVWMAPAEAEAEAGQRYPSAAGSLQETGEQTQQSEKEMS